MPCYLKISKVRLILDMLNEEVKNQVLDELLRQKSDEELHQMSDEEIVELILRIIYLFRLKKMKKEVETIYI
jgi:hypothetical protein